MRVLFQNKQPLKKKNMRCHVELLSKRFLINTESTLRKRLCQRDTTHMLHIPVRIILGVYSAEQIKSADPVTYDYNGNVIPLSERFNPEKKDIRHKIRYPSFAQTDITNNI